MRAVFVGLGCALFVGAFSPMFGLPVITAPGIATTNRVSFGSVLALSAEATSTVSAISFQWRLNSNDIPDATNSTLILNRIRTNDAGIYLARISDVEGATLSPTRTVSIGPTFTRVTNDPVVASSSSGGMAWGDFNRDGWIDLFFTARSSAATTLFANDGRGSFGRAPGNIGAGIANPLGATWADYDNKGALDLFITINNGGNDSLLHNNGDGTFTPVTSGSIVSSAGNGNGCAWADYDNDGFIDLYVANSDGNNFLFHNNRDGTFTRISSGSMVAGTGNSQGCTWIDYDADGFPDLYVSRYTMVNLLFHNNGNGTFTKVTGGPITSDGGNALGFCWGDYDNDGRPDLFIANGGTNNFLYHNNGSGHFTRTNSPTGMDSGSFANANWIDYDNDGWLDLFLVNVTAGSTCMLYHNNADGTFTRVWGNALVATAGRWFSAAWADINNDGFLDVFLTNIGQPNVLHRSDGNDNNWLTVQCLGRLSNRAAIGAKIHVRATIFGQTVWQVREVSGGGNIGCQNQIDPLFGLGNSLKADMVRIEWPSGIVQEFYDVPARQTLTVREPARIDSLSRLNANQVLGTLRGGRGIVYTLEHSTNLHTWTPLATLTNSGGQMTFTDDVTNDFRVYRAVEQ